MLLLKLDRNLSSSFHISLQNDTVPFFSQINMILLLGGPRPCAERAAQGLRAQPGCGLSWVSLV